MGLANSYGIVAYYEYDAWGNLTGTNTAGVTEENLLNANPLRYRGYIYDTETGFYYLQTRYYDPEIGRFINADGYHNDYPSKVDLFLLNLYGISEVYVVPYNRCSDTPDIIAASDKLSWKH